MVIVCNMSPGRCPHTRSRRENVGDLEIKYLLQKFAHLFYLISGTQRDVINIKWGNTLQSAMAWQCRIKVVRAIFDQHQFHSVSAGQSKTQRLQFAWFTVTYQITLHAQIGGALG